MFDLYFIIIKKFLKNAQSDKHEISKFFLKNHGFLKQNLSHFLVY